MGLDSLDVLFAIERRLNVDIDLHRFQGGPPRTVEDLAAMVHARLAEVDDSVELDQATAAISDEAWTSLGLDWLRQELLVHVSTARQHIDEDTPAADAIPLPSRRYLWRLWQQQGLDLPPLLPPEPATRMAAISSLARGVIAGVVLFPLIGTMSVFVALVVWLLSLISTGMILQRWFAWRLPERTCGELARSIALHNPRWFLSRDRRRLTRGDILHVVQAIIAEIANVPLDQIKPHSDLARLLS